MYLYLIYILCIYISKISESIEIILHGFRKKKAVMVIVIMCFIVVYLFVFKSLDKRYIADISQKKIFIQTQI